MLREKLGTGVGLHRAAEMVGACDMLGWPVGFELGLCNKVG